MATSSFFKRPLPKQVISFTSEEGRKIFREAIMGEHMECYFSLSQHFSTQQDPATCGLSSLMICLNALGIDPQRNWKGPWRFFAEELLDCCTPLEVVKKNGITLSEFSCLGRCNGASIKMFRSDQSSLEEFREALLLATSRESASNLNDEDKGPFLVVSYYRKTLGQTGSGHFTPVGGYHKERDLVLLLDTARFKYVSHWVPTELIWEATKGIDPVTNRSRGYFLLTRLQNAHPTIISRTISPGKDFFIKMVEYFQVTIPTVIISNPPTTVKDLVKLLVENLPYEITQIKIKKGSCSDLKEKKSCSCSSEQGPENKLEEDEDACFHHCSTGIDASLNQVPLYSLVKQCWPPKSFTLPFPSSKLFIYVATLLLLGFPSYSYAKLVSEDLYKQLSQLRNTNSLPEIVQDEVVFLQEQMFLFDADVKSDLPNVSIPSSE